MAESLCRLKGQLDFQCVSKDDQVSRFKFGNISDRHRDPGDRDLNMKVYVLYIKMNSREVNHHLLGSHCTMGGELPGLQLS